MHTGAEGIGSCPSVLTTSEKLNEPKINSASQSRHSIEVTGLTAAPELERDRWTHNHTLATETAARARAGVGKLEL